MPTTTFDIFRYQPDADAQPRYQDFSLEHEPTITLLDAILQLQNEQDGTLAIRYSCRSAICGSCACKADGWFVTRNTNRFELPRIFVGNWESARLARQLGRP